MGRRFEESLRNAPVVDFGGYQYFVHPLTDGVPAIHPALLQEVVQEIVRETDLDVDKIVTAEAMGIPLATALSLAAGVPFTIIRKRRYGLPGELAIDQSTGYSKGALYINDVEEGDRVLLVDDVVSTGGTLSAVIGGLKEKGVDVTDVIVLVEKGTGRAEVEKRHDVRIRTLARIEIENGRVIVA